MATPFNKAIAAGGTTMMSGAGMIALPPNTPWWGQMIWIAFWTIMGFVATYFSVNRQPPASGIVQPVVPQPPITPAIVTPNSEGLPGA